MDLADVLTALNGLTAEEQAEVEALALAQAPVFVPQPGPQTEAYFSEADVLLVGGCVSGDTEFLTPNGWKRIDAYSPGDAVAQWAPDGALTFAKPLRYVDVPCEGMWQFETRRLSMRLSPDHRVPVYQYDGKFVVKTAGELAAHPSRHWVPVNFTRGDAPGLPYTDDEIRLGVAVHADGNFGRRARPDYCRITLRKHRKRERLTNLLERLGIAWTEYHNTNRPTEVRYTFRSPITTKTFAGWWGASNAQLKTILEEMPHWDGDYSGAVGGDVCFNTTVKGDADFMQYAAHATGKAATIGARPPSAGNHRPLYRVNIRRETVQRGIGLRVKETSKKGTEVTWVDEARMYCFTTETSFWLARHNGCVFATSNSPGGGKTALGIGLALNTHHRTMVVRKNFVDLTGCLHTLDNILGQEGSATGGNRPQYKKPDGGVIEFVGLGDSIDRFQGNPHDLIYLDEVAQLPEFQVRMLMGWLRTDKPGQRCRVVMGSNPPLDSTGDWMIEYFGPWLDPTHHNPAQPGELRYFLPSPNGGAYRECAPDEFIISHGVRVAPQSRTYIPSRFTDNKYYDAEQYAKSLAGLPDSVRERLVSGNFLLDRADDVWQAIPTSWVKAAQDRWTPVPPVGVPVCAVGVDVAQGGSDNTVIISRNDAWFSRAVVVPGKDTPDGKSAAGYVVKHRRDSAPVVVDLGGGWGGDCYGHLKANGIDAVGYLGIKTSLARTEDRKLGFTNKRSEAYWRLREALDPSRPGGSDVRLPPDSVLLADLCAPRYSVTSNGIALESKESVVKRLGRSPDRGDAAVMTWSIGPKAANIQGGFEQFNRNRVPSVIMARKPTQVTHRRA
jgi:hypothetical protein